MITMLEVLQIQAVALRESQKSAAERVERKPTSEARVKLAPLPREAKTLFDFVPLGFELEAVVKKASRNEVVLRLKFLGKELEIAVKNPLGLEFKPGQRVVLTLIEKNPYVLKLSFSPAESHKMFSRVREFFQSPLSEVLSKLLSPKGRATTARGLTPLLRGLLSDSGLFYENRVVRYLLGKEHLENLKGDLKYRLLQLVKRYGLDRPHYQLVVKPLGFGGGGSAVQKLGALSFFYRVPLAQFASAYSAFLQVSPASIGRLSGLVGLIPLFQASAAPIGRLKGVVEFTKIKGKKTGARPKGGGIKRGALDKPLFLAPLISEILTPLREKRPITYYRLKELLEFIQFLQGWSVVQNYSKAVIPLPFGGKKFFLGIYRKGNTKNISLLWEKGMVRLSYNEGNPFKGELLFVVKDPSLLERLKKHIEELKGELQKLNFTLEDVKFATAQNVEELFILDMADKEHSNFVKLYL